MQSTYHHPCDWQANASDNDFVTQNGFIEFGTQNYADAIGLDFNLQSLAFLVDLD